MVSASFSSSDAISLGKVYLLPVELNLKGYEMLMENKDILLGFKNSSIYLVVGTLINMLLTTLIAYPPVSYTHLDVYKRQPVRCP